MYEKNFGQNYIERYNLFYRYVYFIVNLHHAYQILKNYVLDKGRLGKTHNHHTNDNRLIYYFTVRRVIYFSR